MQKFKMPTAYTIMLIIIIVMAILTWVIPAGVYEYSPNSGEPIAGSYHQTTQNPQGIGDIALAPIKGFIDAIEIATFILMVGGFLGIVMKTGAINAGISNIIHSFRGREKLMIPLLMILFALGGTSFGMAEETIAFYPILLPVFIAAGYDSITAIAVILLGAGIGTLGSTVNPFATGIASGFVGVSIGDGLLLRIVILVVMLIIGIIYIMRYGERVRKNPKTSIVYEQYEENKKHFTFENEGEDKMLMTGKQKIALTLFIVTFLVMIYSVIPFKELGITILPTLGWWFPELSALFFVSAVVIGIVYRFKESEIVHHFVDGAADMVGVALIIGISRGITIIMNNGLITGTILYWGERALTGVGSIAFIAFTYILYIPLSFLIPSTTGLATLTTPIMAPLADFSGVSRELVVTAYQSASGVLNLFTPTSAVVMGALAIGRISFDRYIKFVWKLALLIFLATFALLVLGVIIS